MSNRPFVHCGSLDEYDSRFAMTAEPPVSEWEGHHREQLAFQQFEEAWETARRQITARSS